MARNQQPFCNTSEVLSKTDALYWFKINDWKGFKGDVNTFADLQDLVKPELEYLQSFWHRKENGEADYVKSEKFIPWNCMRAFDDLPQILQDWAQGRTKEFKMDGCCKYDIFHRREEHLENVMRAIHNLFHDWQLVTQGWTAY